MHLLATQVESVTPWWPIGILTGVFLLALHACLIVLITRRIASFEQRMLLLEFGVVKLEESSKWMVKSIRADQRGN